MPNQHKPNPPLESFQAPLKSLWKRKHLTERQILDRLLARHIDTQQYGLGLTKFRQIRKELGLLGTRQQGHTLESITEDMVVLRQQYPKAGRQDIINLLWTERQKRVSRRTVEDYFHRYEKDLVRQRRHRRLRRKRFWAAGGNDLWCVDQHDKWKRYGLGLHTAVDPFLGNIKWLKVWHSNRNPRLIVRYYLETVRRLGFTQGDPGTENFSLAKAHSYIRQSLDPGLVGTLQHRWKRDKKNIPPEIVWSNLRTRWTPGFEDILEAPERYPQLGIRYDRSDPLQYNVFKWLFIPWLQAELDAYADRINNTRKRHQKHKITPQGGSPADMDEYPEEYGHVNHFTDKTNLTNAYYLFQLRIDPTNTILQDAEAIYAPPQHQVFELVPKEFEVEIEAIYTSLGKPEVSRDNVWKIYMDLLLRLEQQPTVGQMTLLPYEEDEEDYSAEQLQKEIAVYQGLADDEGECYLGGVNGGLGPAVGLPEWEEDLIDTYVDRFSDDDDEEMD
ncbi:hypothetical protein VNI00_008426 [Paramarasmius palmivorus]|uniref:Integrase core domain-containing protein n=1 Tax=Paramarasmius palmivorus TaxID=297713 RepID=A0AAW0BU06_9AGAR